MRCGAVVLVAGLLAGGTPAAAAPGRWTGSGGDIPGPAADPAAAATDGLAPVAQGHAEAAWDEALALATAALDAAGAVQGMAPQGTAPHGTAPHGAAPSGAAAPGTSRLGAAVGRLTSLLGPLEGRVRVRPEPTVSDEVSRAAGEVLRSAMEAESASAAAVREAVAVRTQRLVALEQAAAAAAHRAAAMDSVRRLSRLPHVAAPPPEDTSASAGEPSRRPDGRARLRPDAPDGVTRLVRRWANGMIPAEALCPVPFAPRERLQCDAAAALTLLNDAYRAAFGTDLDVVSSYRALGDQVSLRATKGGLAAVPGTSNHGWGLAVDLGGIGGLGDFDAPGYRWLQEHAGAFGWHHPRAMGPDGDGPPEPWHWEFATA